ncbi:DUF3325 family protein [Niveispirillum sp. SYP-B3756]|uniref:DUF3325 domain-containing protein n=1 Tax=Niveispirillum sp. SYP-B3756 TaxID=2662178 RepID=UPI0012911F71|nr:DUF3325 domain-containing protein [Niveispirillum sp. SYP-B3756]MQP68289.1 DUF3325 family protein [Niveispirillum sp. SYP-B3756]
MSLLSWLLALAGFTLLALAMEEHHAWALGREIERPRQRLWRGLGFALLGLSWVAAAAGWGPAVGTVTWCGVLSVAAAPLVLARTYVTPPRRR